MRLTFAGSGSAFTTGDGNYQSNMVIEREPGGPCLLIDCGSDARFSLHDLGIGHRRIDTVYISHLHADHVGGLEWLAFTTYFDPACRRPRLCLPIDVHRRLWANVLQGGLGLIDTGPARLESYFDPEPIPERGSFDWQGLRFTTVPVPHVMHAGPDGSRTGMHSHGLLFTANGTRAYISTDSMFEPDPAQRPYAAADIIFQDCEIAGRSGVHAPYQSLRTLPAEIRARMWLYHFEPGPKPDAIAHGFRGFVQKGQSFSL